MAIHGVGMDHTLQVRNRILLDFETPTPSEFPMTIQRKKVRNRIFVDDNYYWQSCFTQPTHNGVMIVSSSFSAPSADFLPEPTFIPAVTCSNRPSSEIIEVKADKC